MLECSSKLSLFSPLSPQKSFSGFPFYNIASSFGVREIKLLANVLAKLISRLLLPVHTVPVPSPTKNRLQFGHTPSDVQTGSVDYLYARVPEDVGRSVDDR